MEKLTLQPSPSKFGSRQDATACFSTPPLALKSAQALIWYHGLSCVLYMCVYMCIYILYVYVYIIQSCSNILLTCVPNIHSLMQDIIQDIDYFSPPCSERWSCGAWWHHRPHMLHRIQTGWDSPWFRLLKQKKLKATTIKENRETKVQQKKQLRRKWNNSDWQQAFVVFHCAPKITE